MINLDLNFIAEHRLDIAWDIGPRECVVTYYHYVEGRSHGGREFRTRAILDSDLNINLLLGSLRKVYDYLNPIPKNE